MTSPKRMSKIAVLGSKSHMEEVIEELHEMGVYHITEHEADELDIGEPLPSGDRIDEALVTVKSIISKWVVEKTEVSDLDINIEDAIGRIKSIESKNRRYREDKEELSERISDMHRALHLRELLGEMDISPEYLTGLDSVRGFVGVVQKPGGIEETLDQVTDVYDYRIRRIGGRNYLAVFVETEKSEEMLEALKSLGFDRVDVETLEEFDTEQEIKEELKETKEKWAEINAKHYNLNEDNKSFLLAAERELSKAADKAEAPLDFAVSDNAFYIEGYLPTDDVDSVEEQLKNITGGEIAVMEREIEDLDEVPIEMDHKKPVEPFEFFMDLYSLPKYIEVDPTMLTFITFPMLFGFMLGDMGYGLVTLILFLSLKKWGPESIERLVNILIFASIWTLIFGAFFGEIFGKEVIFGVHLPHVMSRMHEMNKLLLVSIAVGVVHVNIGLIVGFYNEYKAHGLKAAIFEKFGWIVLEVGAALLLLNYQYGTVPVWQGLTVTGIAVAMIFKGEGVKGLVELPSIFSNILSYARLMAIGLASAGLAIVVNDFATQFFSTGGWSIIPGVLILVVGHSINVALGMLGPFLHSLRLHYVEFFTKFYKGGGKPYQPFGTEWR